MKPKSFPQYVILGKEQCEELEGFVCSVSVVKEKMPLGYSLTISIPFGDDKVAPNAIRTKIHDEAKKINE